MPEADMLATVLHCFCFFSVYYLMASDLNALIVAVLQDKSVSIIATQKILPACSLLVLSPLHDVLYIFSGTQKYSASLFGDKDSGCTASLDAAAFTDIVHWRSLLF